MNEKLSSLVKKVFITSMASLSITHVHSKDVEYDITIWEDNRLKVDLNVLKLKKPKLLLTQAHNNNWELIAHRSHRSHSSHRSHYSSSAGSSSSRSSSSGYNNKGTSASSRSLGITSTPYKPTIHRDDVSNLSNSQNNKTLNSNDSSKSNSLLLTPTILKLGDRTLKIGMSGSDVTELINVLLKKGYVKLENGDTGVSRIHTFDDTLEAVIKRFQINNGLTNDGICGPLTIYYLLNR